MVSTRWVIPWVLLALWTGTGRVHAMVVDQWAPFTQPDSTTFAAHVFGDEFEINWVTGDGYAFVHNPADGYLYYAELDSQGDFRASNAKVGIDDPAAHGIAPHLQRSAKRRAALQAERVASGYIKDPKRQASGGRHGDPTHVPCTGTSPCDVYVVMVSFVDASSGSYANYDQPWGYSMAQFNQFFNGGYEGVPEYTGTIAHTAPGKSTENLTVFGSLRAYFHQVHGEDILRFHILNECENDPCGTRDQPVWIGLPNTKAWYASRGPGSFWPAAETAASANLTLPADFPYETAAAATQIANKVLYLYAGATLDYLGGTSGLLPVLWPSGAGARGSRATRVSPCTLDVVLVTFRDTTAARAGVAYDYRSDNTQILNNTLHSTGGDRGKGIQFKGGTSGLVRNTIASGFPGGGVVAPGQGAVSEKAEDVVRVDYYLGHANGDADLSGTVTSTRRALWSAPRFRDAAAGDYTLQADSPGLDLGTPGVSGLPAKEGSRLDLGRYGGTEQSGKARGRLALEEYFSNSRLYLRLPESTFFDGFVQVPCLIRRHIPHQADMSKSLCTSAMGRWIPRRFHA